MIIDYGLVNAIAEEIGMTHEKAARIAEAFAEQRVERHELVLTENRLSCSVENLSTKIEALSSGLKSDVAQLRTEAGLLFWKQAAGLTIVAIACSSIIIGALSLILR